MTTFDELRAMKEALRELPGFLEEVDRLLHNFVASVMSFRDHTLRVRKTLLPTSGDDRPGEEYELRARETFEAPLLRFVQQLRHYTPHHRLPRTSGHDSMRRRDRGGEEWEFNSAIVLSREELMNGRNGSPAAPSFIEADEGNIAIEDVASSYVSLVVGFDEWFREALQDRQAHALAELERERQRVRRAWLEAAATPEDPASETLNP